MSVDYDVFVSVHDCAQVVACLQPLTILVQRPPPDESQYVGAALGMDVFVYQHELEDDRELLFTCYPVQVALRPLRVSNLHVRDDFAVATSLFLMTWICDRLQVNTMAVRDVQKVLGRMPSEDRL